MSERKPPPRPPPPRPPPPRQATKASTQGRFRDAFTSISIRYSNASKDSDSDEEISIVRKAEGSSPDVQESDLDDKEHQAFEVTRDTPEDNTLFGNVATNGRPTNRDGNQRSEQRPVESKPVREKGYVSYESGTALRREEDFSKRRSWPVASSANHLPADSGKSMKFLRAREQSSRPEAPPKLVPPSEREELDAGSQPSKSHLQVDDNETTASNSRPRSPSPFRRFRQDATQKKASISLSSLLAADKKCESGPESYQTEDFLQTFSKPTSPESNTKSMDHGPISLKSNRLEGSRVVDSGPTFSTFCFCTLVVYIYYMSTPPPFLSGLFTGVIFTYLAGCIFLWLFCPRDTMAERFQREMLEYEDRLASMPPYVYKSLDPGLLTGIRELKGWMFKAYDYNPESFDFNSETTPVFAFLKGTKLTLSHPNFESSTKRFDSRTVEDDSSISFLRHEFFDITGSSISVLPPSLTLKRLWSKKFPICLELGSPGAITEETLASTDEESEKSSFEKMRSHKSFEDIAKLYLFARTGREKEEWYNHLCKTLNPDKAETCSDLDAILQQSCSYPHYMASILPLADSKLQQAQIAWVNVLFGRAFWDVWQSQYWADKIRQRFQNKLSKMRKPQFIKDICIADLSLGHSLPTINRASPPVVDERGTWVDLDVMYSGGLVFTLEGHLNVEGYLRYFIDLGRGGSNDVAADLEMTELHSKYDLTEDEESVIVTAKNATKVEEEDVESDSPPLSDSDFESPESDFEDFPSLDCQSFPSSPLLSPKMDIFHNAIESNTESEDAVGAKAQPGTHVFPSKPPVGPEEQSRSSSDEPDSSKLLSPLSNPGKEPDKQMDSNPSGFTRITQVDMLPKTGARKKIFGVLERLAKSKWVKKAVETDLVKRAAEKFSNVPIILSVEVQTIKGTLALNIPPPPSNRLWYGFRGNPMLFVSAKPKLGERQVNLTHVTDWIEKKLKHEFKNMFVLPNMEDLPIKLMNSGFEGQFPEQ